MLLSTFTAGWNPDCYTQPDQLDADIDQLAAISRDKSQPENKQLALQLIDYCLWKCLAMRARLHGSIAQAREHESNCDRIYRSLPESARW